ncbi:MAG: roadblock/LC7 domain-containing protein [Acidobacteriota bacterium]|nr:MAG: roadblock/LC7 domain-containing protein [Acidobacteriota bacterium]
MSTSELILYEEEFQKIKSIIAKLKADANAKLVFVVDRNGQQIAQVGDITDIDTTSLASLTAGNVAATDGLARLMGQEEFNILFHEGRHDNVHISIVGRRVILVVIFDERSSLGLVRLRVKRSTVELEQVFDTIMQKVEQERTTLTQAESPFAEITDDDIDSLFGD